MPSNGNKGLQKRDLKDPFPRNSGFMEGSYWGTLSESLTSIKQRDLGVSLFFSPEATPPEEWSECPVTSALPPAPRAKLTGVFAEDFTACITGDYCRSFSSFTLQTGQGCGSDPVLCIPMALDSRVHCSIHPSCAHSFDIFITHLGAPIQC